MPSLRAAGASDRSQFHKNYFIRKESYKLLLMYGPELQQLPAHFKALASPTRLRILERLAEVPEVSVKELAVHLRMSQPRVSWHLALLRRGGAVRQRKEGRQVYCSIDLDAIRRQQLAFWELLNEKRRIGVKV